MTPSDPLGRYQGSEYRRLLTAARRSLERTSGSLGKMSAPVRPVRNQWKAFQRLSVGEYSEGPARAAGRVRGLVERFASVYAARAAASGVVYAAQHLE